MDEVKVCVDGHIIYIIYMSYYNSQDLAHTADVFCLLKATSSGWVEGSKCQKELQLIIERGLTTQQILNSRF